MTKAQRRLLTLTVGSVLLVLITLWYAYWWEQVL